MTRILCICQAYAFLEAQEVPLEARLPIIIMISPIGPGLQFFVFPFGSWCFGGRLSNLSHPTNFCSFPYLMSFSICSFKPIQSFMR